MLLLIIFISIFFLVIYPEIIIRLNNKKNGYLIRNKKAVRIKTKRRIISFIKNILKID